MTNQPQAVYFVAAFRTALANAPAAIVGIARRYRWWFAGVTVLAMVLCSYWAGLSRGMSDGESFQRQLETYIFALASDPKMAADAAERGRLLSDRVDSSVLRYHQRRSATGSQKIWNALSTLYWIESESRANLDEVMRRQAERRLLVVQPLRPETIDILRQMGKEDVIAEIQADYVEIAAAYSAVLGREVTVKQLVPDARVRYRYDLGDLSAR
jgi:hypothetical protein